MCFKFFSHPGATSLISYPGTGTIEALLCENTTELHRPTIWKKFLDLEQTKVE
jgi:hypothetical protein